MELEPKQFASALAQICEEKGISQDKAMDIVEQALVAAYRKDYGKKGQNLKIKFNEVTGDMEVTLIKEVVETVEDEDGNVLVIEFSDEDKEESGQKAEKKKSVLAAAFDQAKQDKAEGKDKDILRDEEPLSKETAALAMAAEENQTERPRRKFNPESHMLLSDARKIDPNIKVGDTLTFPMPKPEGFGRIAAQTAKQVIIQRVREAEREAIFDEFREKEGEIVSGIVQRIERGSVYVDLGRAVGIIYPQEQIPGENYRIGMRLKVYVIQAQSNTKEPAVALSRSSSEFVRKLFEMEVPEVFSGVVEIKAIAREAGSRSKIAVIAKEESIDPVGSCVGQKGTRVQTIINELNGEKVDIIEWDSDPIKFISNALSPAKITNVEIVSQDEHYAKVEVPVDQLSLAIGKQGQNVRLAAKLVEWRIDVFSPEVAETETVAEIEPSEAAEEPAEAEEKKDLEEKTKSETEEKAEKQESAEDSLEESNKVEEK